MSTTVVNLRQSKYDIYIGRGSKWGNPYTHHDFPTKAQFIVGSREESIVRYQYWISERPYLIEALTELKGKVLG